MPCGLRSSARLGGSGIHVCISTDICICTHVHVQMSMCIYIYVICVDTFVHLDNICIYTYMHTYLYICMYPLATLALKSIKDLLQYTWRSCFGPKVYEYDRLWGLQYICTVATLALKSVSEAIYDPIAGLACHPRH